MTQTMKTSSHQLSWPTLKKELTAAKKKAKALEQTFVAELIEAQGRSLRSDAKVLCSASQVSDLTDH